MGRRASAPSGGAVKPIRFTGFLSTPVLVGLLQSARAWRHQW